MSQPYGLGAGVVPPPVPPPAGPPRWYPSAPPPPGPPRRRGPGAAVGVAAALIITALLAGATGALIASERQAQAPAATPTAAAPATDPKVSMCETLEAEYPQIVAAINERNKFDNAPWTDPGLVAAAGRLAEVTRTSADRLERSIGEDLSPSDAKAGSDYVTALRAMSISESNQAPAKQLNGIASLYNSVVDPVLAVCGIKG